jgi:hypothetical protein
MRITLNKALPFERNMAHSSLASLVSKIQGSLRECCDDLKCLSESTCRESLTTVMSPAETAGSEKRAARAQHFTNDPAWSEAVSGLPDDIQKVLIRRSAAISGLMCTQRAEEVFTACRQFLVDDHLSAHSGNIKTTAKLLTEQLARLSEINAKAADSASRFPPARLAAIDDFERDLSVLTAAYKSIDLVIMQQEQTDAKLRDLFDPSDILGTAKNADRVALQSLHDTLTKQVAELHRRVHENFDSSSRSNSSGVRDRSTENS